MKVRTVITVISVVAVLGTTGFIGCSSLQAQGARLFTDRAAWTAAASDIVNIDFSGLTGVGTIADFTVRGQGADPKVLTLSGVRFLDVTSFNGPNALWVVDPLYDPSSYDWGSGPVLRGPGTNVFSSGSNLRIELPPGRITAIGMDLMTVAPFGGRVQVFLSSGSVFFIQTNNFPTRTFAGFISTTPINFITLSSPGYPVIDDFSFGLPVQNGWSEDFEHYAVGVFPAPNWTFSGNSDIRIDNNFRASGDQSVRLYGAVGGCWGALLHRPLNLSSSFTIEFQTRNGSEPLSGCHPLRSVIALYTGASWTTSGRKIISFDGDGQIRGSSSPSNGPSGSVLGTYATGEWIKTKVTYERLDSSTVRLSYWINDQLKKTEVLAALSYEGQLAYLSPAVAEGTAWYDAIKITPGVASSPVSITTSTVPTLQVGQSASFKFDATLGQPPYTWSLVNGTLPPGMTLRSDGTVSGIPAQAGQFTVSITVQDNSGLTATKTFSFVVAALPTVGQLPTGLVSRWLADGNANDTENVNNGELQNGTTFAPGKSGGAFSLDGIDDVVNVPHSPTLNVANSHTIAAWAFRTSSAVPQHLVGKRVGCGFDTTFIQLAIGTNAVPSSAVPLNTWSHLAVTYNGSVASSYVNGILVASWTTTLGNNTAPLLIGRSGTCAPFSGLIDDVQLYNRPLAQSEIQSIMQTGLSITTSTVPTLQIGLPSSFKFDATLGQPPYTWSLGSGTLPPGMTLRSDGTVSGTPTQTGQFTFSIRVRDSLGITATSTFTLAVAAQSSGGLLVEDFEDGILDPRISVQTAGTFSAGPGIKNLTNFGSTKAFGFGLSVCGASCFFSFASTLRITFPAPEFVVSISFKEMELFSNWGSGGGVFIDGQPISADCRLPTCGEYTDFGRSPVNDFQPDTTFRSRSFSVNRAVTTIELRVNDISNLSEIYIDDLVIMGLPVPFTFLDRGGVSLRTLGTSAAPVSGYASIQPSNGSSTPSGLAIFGFRQNNVLVTEASVPASALLQAGRIYAEVDGPINTGLAIANPNSQLATVSFFFTGPNGDFGTGITTIPANGQIARFLNETPFNSGPSVSGAFTFTSSVPIAVVALRGRTNERGDFLVTTLPVADLGVPASSGTIIFPQFADGGGSTTQIVLVNPGDSLLTGTVQFLDPSGGTATVVVNGQASSSFGYSIPARTSQKLQTSGMATPTLSGSVRVIPDSGTTAPSAVEIFSYSNGGVTVTEAGVPAVAEGAAFRLYSEAAGTLGLPGSIQTGLAVANTSSSVARVLLELHRLDGSSTGLTGTLTIPPNGRVATFLNEIQGFASLQKPFQGILRVSSPSLISVIGLRARYNERGDFLITTTPASNEAAPPSTATLLFPQIVDSSGYTTQFILFSGKAGQSSSGVMRLFSQSGAPLSLAFTGTTNSLTVLYSTGFEPPSYSLGPLLSKDGWSILRTSDAVNVQSAVVASGSQAVVVDAAIGVGQTGPHHAVVSSPSNTYVLMEADVRLTRSSDMTAWQFGGLSCDNLSESSCQFIGGFNVLPDGRLQIITGGFPITAAVVSRDIWNHYVVFFNFSTQTFDIYINGALIAARNPLLNPRTTFGRFIFDTFDSSTGNDKGYIDNLQIATVP